MRERERGRFSDERSSKSLGGKCHLFVEKIVINIKIQAAKGNWLSIMSSSSFWKYFGFN